MQAEVYIKVSDWQFGWNLNNYLVLSETLKIDVHVIMYNL